jgi:hypothetical protein
MVRGLQNGLGTRLGVIPQQTPVNPKKNKNWRLTKWLPQVNFQAPNPIILKSLCLKKWFVWIHVLLVHVQLPQETPQSFFPVPEALEMMEVVSCRFFTHQ